MITSIEVASIVDSICGDSKNGGEVQDGLAALPMCEVIEALGGMERDPFGHPALENMARDYLRGGRNGRSGKNGCLWEGAVVDIKLHNNRRHSSR